MTEAGEPDGGARAEHQGSTAAWDVATYTRFADERSRPFLDLVARVRAPSPRTVVEAQNAARDRKHGTVGTEHLLLGLYAAGDGNLATVALDHLGLDRAAAERLVDARVAPGSAAPVKGHIRFSPGAKKTLELALRHALELGHNYIGTEHIVLALRQVEDGVAAQVMAEAGIGYDDLRAEVLVALRKITGDA